MSVLRELFNSSRDRRRRHSGYRENGVGIVSALPNQRGIETFHVGDYVTYVPGHVQALKDGNVNHPDCERGHVTSKNEKYVFVRYGSSHTSQATDPRDLR